MPHPLERDLEHILRKTADLWDAFRGVSIFITGGTGFVGTWLVESFVWANERLNLGASATVLTRRHRPPCHPSVTFLQGDARYFEAPTGQFRFLIHSATESNVERTGDNKAARLFLDDLAATRHVLEFARACGTERLLFTSSGAVYGKQPPQLTHISEDYRGAPASNDTDSAYGQCKRASEFLCAAFARQFGFAAVIARLFTFVGPHLPLDRNFAVGNFIRDVLAGGPIYIAGDGSPYRSYLYAADLAIWLWRLLLLGDSADPYNVGSDADLTITQLAHVVAQNTNPACPIIIAQSPAIGAKPARYVPSINRAQTQLGLEPFIPLSDGVRRMYDWHRYCSMK